MFGVPDGAFSKKKKKKGLSPFSTTPVLKGYKSSPWAKNTTLSGVKFRSGSPSSQV